MILPNSRISSKFELVLDWDRGSRDGGDRTAGVDDDGGPVAHDASCDVSSRQTCKI